MPEERLRGTELDRQVATLVALGYPALAREDEAVFTARFEPLREAAVRMGDLPPARPGGVPLVLVVTREVVDPELTVPLLRLAGGGVRPGALDPNHGEDGLAPYLDWATPTFYDTVTAGIQELLGGGLPPDQFLQQLQRDYSAFVGG